MHKKYVFERKDIEMVDLRNMYRMSVLVDERCKIVSGDERMELVNEFKYLGTVLSQHGEIEEVRERESSER